MEVASEPVASKRWFTLAVHWHQRGSLLPGYPRPTKPRFLELGPRRPCVSELPTCAPCAAKVEKTALLSGRCYWRSVFLTQN